MKSVLFIGQSMWLYVTTNPFIMRICSYITLMFPINCRDLFPAGIVGLLLNFRLLFQPEGYEIISQRLSVAAFFVKPEKTHVFLSAAPLGQNSCAPLRRGQKPSFGQPVPGSFSAAEPEFFSHSAQIPSKNKRCRIILYPEFSSVSASRKGLYEYGASVTFLHFTQYI